MQTVLKVLGIAVLIVVGFKVLFWALGVAISMLFWTLVVGAVLLVGAGTYAALKGKSGRNALR
ncbi:MAG: hypothetical protein ACRDRA_00850 [Pseudonocardiaceae bacterium]